MEAGEQPLVGDYAAVVAAAEGRGRGRADDRRTARRRALIDSALEHFARAGYAASPIEQICQEAGVGYKAFYDEFGSKEALFMAVYDAVVGKVLADVYAVLGPEHPPDERHRVIIATYLQSVLGDPRWPRILFLVSSGVSEAVDLHKREADRVVAALVADLYRSGFVGREPPPEVDSSLLGTAVIGAISALVTDFVLDPAATDVDELTAGVVWLVETLFAGIAATGS